MGEISQPHPDDISSIPNWFTVYGWKGQIDGCMLYFDNYWVLQWRFFGEPAVVPGNVRSATLV